MGRRVFERWKIIEDFPDYAISTCGRVKRIGVAKNGTYPGRILKPFATSQGYKVIRLFKNCEVYTVLVHHLVLNQFIKRREMGKECNHKNGNTGDNHVWNLEWVTKSENEKYAHRTGLKRSNGENNSNAKLTNNDVLKIRNMYASDNFSQHALAKRFGVTQSSINKIVLKKSYVEV